MLNFLPTLKFFAKTFSVHQTSFSSLHALRVLVFPHFFLPEQSKFPFPLSKFKIYASSVCLLSSNIQIFILKNFTEVELIYNVLISAVSKVIQLYILFHVLFHYSLSQDIEYSFLCCLVGPCCLSILYIIVCICESQTPNPSLPSLTPTRQPLFSMSVSLFLFHRFVHFSFCCILLLF